MITLTCAQALVRWLIAQRTELVDGTDAPLFPGVFAIFGHGNVLGLGTALHERHEELPVWRGHNEQGMALAAIGYAKARERRQACVVTSSIGPGALNMVTAAGVANANRLPVLLLPGDTFASRAPDPVLQQIENFTDPTITVNDAFRPVSRYFDRITRPEQLIATLPHIARVLTDPADTGPVTLALPQDVQAENGQFPESLFETVHHRIPRPHPDPRDISEASAVLATARRPLLVLGGGTRYSGAGAAALQFAEKHGIPVTETTAGRTLVPHNHELYAGPLGITGSASANALAAEADVVLAIGTRLGDFTTASWTVFSAETRLISVNVARFDAVKHGAIAVTGDALACITELSGPMTVDPAWTTRASIERLKWDAAVDQWRAPREGLATYAGVVGAVNAASGPDDYVMTSSGGFPGELVGGWRASGSNPAMDVEYGFSCMGYEIAGAWGAAMARRRGIVTTLLGDGSYLMLNSELYSAAFSGHGFIAVVCDNGGYAVIDRLQRDQGGAPFNNMYADCRTELSDSPPTVDFAAHAAALGAEVIAVDQAGEFVAAYDKARTRAAQRPVVITIRTHPQAWTESGAWWEVGVPQTADRQEITTARTELDTAKATQLRHLKPN